MSKRILVLAPHTDDGEFGCGGTIKKFIDSGYEVYYAAFSIARRSVPKHLPEDILLSEVKQATRILGINSEYLLVFDYDVRTFPEFRQDILEDLVKLNNDIKPDIVFMPSLNDAHQDHKTIAEEGFRAFKRSSSILCYELPWNNISFNTTFFSVLELKHLEFKVKSVECYKSQTFRKYASMDFIKSLARVRGAQIDVDFAEAFEVVRWIEK